MTSRRRVGRPSKVERFRPQIAAALAQNPTISTAAVIRLLQAEGYDGDPSRVYRLLQSLRPRPLCEIPKPAKRFAKPRRVRKLVAHGEKIRQIFEIAPGIRARAVVDALATEGIRVSRSLVSGYLRALRLSGRAAEQILPTTNEPAIIHKLFAALDPTSKWSKDPVFDEGFSVESDGEKSGLTAATAVAEIGHLLSESRRTVIEVLDANHDHLRARAARSVCTRLLAELEVLFHDAAAKFAQLCEIRLDEPEAQGLVREIFSHYADAQLKFERVRAKAAPAMVPAPEPPTSTPFTSTPTSWSDCAGKTREDVLKWTKRNRGDKGKVLILRPSPSTGKTESMIATALEEQANRQRVLFSVATKAYITDEVVPRFQQKRPYVRLHVITGRDQDNCPNFDNIQAVQAHGHQPGPAVCVSCEKNPAQARRLGQQICGYFRTRTQASTDYTTAHHATMIPYPIIATTHSGVVNAILTGGGMYGSFWKSDLIFFDEDPTNAFEPATVLTGEHLAFDSAKPEHRATSLLAWLLRQVVSEARRERIASRGRGYRNNGVPDIIHSQRETIYAGHDLHALIRRTAEVYQFGISVDECLRNAIDYRPHLNSGELCGLRKTDILNTVLPHGGFADVADALFQEMEYFHKAKKDLDGYEIDFPYIVRLEGSDASGFRFVLQESNPFPTSSVNVVVGDAYANVDHYRSLFNVPASKPNDPNYIDPVTVVEHVAVFPAGTRIVRMQCRASISQLVKNDHLLPEHLATNVAWCLHQLRGKRVLFYGHLAMRKEVEQYMANNDFGLEAWAYEHWWGGRGKDAYKDYDAIITLSDPIQNLGGMVHMCNARTFRAAQHGEDIEERLRLCTGNNSISDIMCSPKTHWRIRAEHQRVNVGELSQAIHRVRGLMKPKLIFVLAQEVELSPDILASTEHVSPNDVAPNKATVEVAMFDDYLNWHEIKNAMDAAIDHFGFWSPAFNHALVSLGANTPSPLDSLEPNVSGTGPVKREESLNSPPGPVATALATADSATAPQPSAAHESRLSFLARVWNPPADWQLVNGRLAVTGSRKLRNALAAVREDMLLQIHVKPKWATSSQSYRGYFAEHDRAKIEFFQAMLDKQYGPKGSHGRLHAPEAESFVPF